MDHKDEEMMSVKDLAEYLKVHVITVYRWLGRGIITGNKIGGVWRFRRSKVDKRLSKEVIGYGD
jgi:excisionase family DNA binding protein